MYGNIKSIISDTDMRRHAKVRENLVNEVFKTHREAKIETIEM